MTEEEFRAWKDWLMVEGRTSRPFSWGRARRKRDGHSDALAAVAMTADKSESEYDYEPALNRVIERSADGKRYIVGVTNGELQRLQELADEKRPGVLAGRRRMISR
jgi:hypothetical protein